MSMAINLLPIPRRRSPANRATRTARRGLKAYAALKATSLLSRGLLRGLALPAAVAGGALLWRKLRSSSSPPASTDRPLGPVASPQAVSPPAPAADPSAEIEDARKLVDAARVKDADKEPGDDVLDDPPAGAANPPASALDPQSS